MTSKQIIFSPTGGTRRVAEIITSEWSDSTETLDLSDPTKDFTRHNFDADDMVLIAFPSYSGRVPEVAAKKLRRMRGAFAQCALLCVYGNRAYEDTLAEMAYITGLCGFTAVAAVAAVAEHSIMHQYATGRPDSKDIQDLKSYARLIKERMDVAPRVESLPIPGHRPYDKIKHVGLVPKAKKNCVHCGLCAEQCPVQAIDPENLEKADPKACISCMRCVARCPHSARTANKGKIALASLAMKRKCSVRKDCELFM